MSGNGPFTGEVFGNRYEIGERIGVGGMAEVYSAQDNVLGRIVAVKVMLPQYADDADFTRRFRQEAAAAANLQSPYIVNVYDWGNDEGTYYIVMEYVRGSDLKTAIQQRGAINQKKVAEIGAQVCQALTVAHQQDIIHRDIKPQNIMVQPDGNVKVMDFGIARAKNSTADKTQTVLGTAHYASPEQAQGKELSPASDIYSLGVVLYEAATGTLPFDGPDAVSVALMQVQDIPPAPREVNPNISPELETIILTAMQKNPAERFATTNDLRIALNDFLAGKPIADSLTSAKTAVISPISTVSSDQTQVMPAVAGQQTMPMNSVKGATTYSAHGTQKKSNKKPAIIAICCIVALAIIGGVAFALLGGGERVPVPNVVGMQSDVAVTAIEQEGFSVGKMESVFDDSVEAGTVISQTPAGGTEAQKGSKIDLVVSQGNEQIEVPSVEGMTLEDARKLLVTAGFAIGQTNQVYSDTVEAGLIVSQNPAAGSMMPKGTSIVLEVSQGEDKVAVPNIEGLNLEAATKRITELGLTLSQSGSQNSDTIDAQCIISQSPAAGTKVDKGTNVTYVISLGEKAVTVPNVIGYNETHARDALASAGLQVSVSSVDSNEPKGTVVNQSPGSGSSAKRGDSVSISVSKGPSTPSGPGGEGQGSSSSSSN